LLDVVMPESVMLWSTSGTAAHAAVARSKAINAPRIANDRRAPQGSPDEFGRLTFRIGQLLRVFGGI
jgi:hypothetical protein